MRGCSLAAAAADAPATCATCLPCPSGLRASNFSWGSDEYFVLSYPAASPALPTSLTPTEREVAASLLLGHSNRQIAFARRVAVRTVANQVAAVLRKAAVRSRFELVRKFTG
jgi:DNA-binding NarL/FixJ family response regulator